MNDIHALSGAYAVDALDDDERAEFERHLAVCADCHAEVASFHETTALLAEPEAETPPASLRAHVLSGIAEVRPLPPVPGNAGTVTTLRRRHLPQLLAAAAAIVLLAVGAVLWHPWSSSQASIADQVLHAPDAVTITEKVGHGPGELTLVRSASLKRAVLVGSHVPAAGSGKTYQMWLQQPGEGMVSAGLMPDADEPTLLTGDAATATAAAVSVEPDTGSSHPTSDPIALFPLKSASTGNDGT